jgi:hypothetical protein
MSRRGLAYRGEWYTPIKWVSGWRFRAQGAARVVSSKYGTSGAPARLDARTFCGRQGHVSPEETITADELAGPDEQLESDDADERIRRRRRREVAALAALAAALALIIWWILNNTVIVPKVVGLDRGEALIRLTAAELQVGEVTTVPSQRYRFGEVALQGPLAGQRVLRGSDVDLALAQDTSAGGDGGSSAGLEDSGLAYTAEEWGAWEQRDTSQPKPRTYSTDLPPNTVPMVQGLSEKKARSTLKAAGYPVKVKYGCTSSGPGKGYIFFQYPEPYAPEAEGTRVEIWVSTGGPEPGESCPVPRVPE